MDGVSYGSWLDLGLAQIGGWMRQTDQPLQPFNLALLLTDLLLLLFDERLLLFEGVDENGRELIVSDPFNLPLSISKGEQRLDLLHFFCGQADVAPAVSLPGKANRAQAVDDLHAADERLHVRFIAQARRTTTECREAAEYGA